MTLVNHVILLERNGPAGAGLSEMDLDPVDFQSPLPTQHVHVYYSDSAIGLNIDVWDTTTMQEAFGPYPGDEFVWSLEGDFRMVHGTGEAVSVKTDDCAYFRNAIATNWHKDGYLKKFYITYLDPNAETPNIKSAKGGAGVLDPDAEPEIMGTTEPFEIEGPVPVQKNHTIFTNDANTFFVGTWESGPMISKMLPFPTHEFVRMLEGEVSIAHRDGTARTFCGGDCFFVPKGTVCNWDIPTFVKMHYAVLDVE